MKTKTSVLTVVLVLMAFIVAIVVLCSTVFCVSSIKVVWHTSTIALTGQDDNMIQKSGLTTGQSVFLVGKDESVQKLESSYPYVKVLGIETVFPSTLNIHLQEREILYVIQISSSSYAFVDQDFKVLEIKNGYEDREQFLEFCLKDNYLRNLYDEKVYPAQLQYMDGEISRKDLNNAIDAYLSEARREYSFEDYTEVSGQAVEYEIGRNLSFAGSATMAVSMALGIGAGITVAASATKEEEEEKILAR